MTGQAVSLPPITKRENRLRLEKSPAFGAIASGRRAEIFKPFQNPRFADKPYIIAGVALNDYSWRSR